MFSALKEFITRHETITIFSHIYPDGDAIGSIIGLRELIKANYPTKKVYGIGAVIAPFSQIVGDLHEVDDDTIKQSGALIIDVANGDRVFDQRFKLAKESFKLDHHVYVEKFTNDELVVTNRIATAEIIGEFMIQEHYSISPLGATALLLGIITDSGRFMYDLTTTITFEVVANLMAFNADLKLINNVLSQRKIDGLKARGLFMLHYETYQGVIYIIVDNPTLKTFALEPNQGSMFVNTYAGIEGYHSWATFLVDENGGVFVELRSTSRNVQKVATAFGGGGHLKASGCRLANMAMIDEVIKTLANAEEIN